MPKFVKPTEAKLWYYEDFLTILEDNLMMPSRSEDWKRLQMWDGEKLVPVMPDGFAGTPSDAQMETLYKHMKDGKLFLFELGKTNPTQLDHWHLKEVNLAPQAPIPPVPPKLDPVPVPNVPNPMESDDPDSIPQDEFEANRAIWLQYNLLVSEQERVMNNFRAVEIAYNEERALYDNNVKLLNELGQGFIDSVNAYNNGRDLEQENREANARNLNADLRKDQRNRNKAEHVTTNLMAPRPEVVHEIFFDQNRDVPAPDRGIQHSSATFDYEVFEKYIEPAGYDMYLKNVFSDYDAATINMAMLGATTEMENAVRTHIKDVGGPLGVKNQAIDSMYFLVGGTFGKVRKHQPSAALLGAAMGVGKESMKKYFEGDPTMLAKNLAESVRNIKTTYSSQQQSDLSVDLVSGTNLAERILKLFDKFPDILAASGLQEKDLEFLKGYVQMGKVFDNYTEAHIKLNDAAALGTDIPVQEKAGLLADVVIRRMIEMELVKDQKQIENSDAYNKFLAKAMEDDQKLEEQYVQWKNQNYPNSNNDEQIIEEYKKTHDLSQNINATSRYPADHKVIALLARPGMLDRLRQVISNDPAILEMARQPELPIKGGKLYRGSDLDNLAKNLQPELQNSAYTENEKHNWFVSMKSMLVKGKVNTDTDAISPWFNSKIAGDADRLMVVQTDEKGNKTLLRASDLLENGLKSLENPDQKTINQLHNWASDGNLYYYEVGKDMPLRLNANAEKASFEHPTPTPKISVWMKIAYYCTFGNAYAKEMNFVQKDRDPEAADLFAEAKAARAERALNEDQARRQAAPKGKAPEIDIAQRWNAPKQAENDPYDKAVGKALDDIHSFKKPMAGILTYPDHTDGKIDYKVYQMLNDKTYYTHEYIYPKMADLYREMASAAKDPKTTTEQIRELMARAVLMQSVKKEQLLHEAGVIGPIEQQMRENPKAMIDLTMADPTFKAYTHNASVDMLRHFIVADGEINMEHAIAEANKLNLANAEKENAPEAQQKAPEQVKQDVGIGMN